jgi:hypothetical protein
MIRITPTTFLVMLFISRIISCPDPRVKVIANQRHCYYKRRNELSSCDSEKALS